MFKEAVRQIRTAFILLVLLTVLTGLIYPLLVTGVAQFLFPWQANGSIISQDGKPVGSLLIGQSFTSPGYFWGRPSATPLFPYNGEASSGSNSGPSNPSFLLTVKERVAELKKLDSESNNLVPVDLVTASGSGLDPEISPLAARYQIPRIANARHIPEQVLEDLVQKHIEHRTFYLLGEQRVNVLKLNLALDNLRMSYGQSTPES
ncbi:potassium-transporting ATPase subunit KdpC [Legionella sp. km535]|uniref:potassium-transporting ATPase subunit KdpC n=1 Tax=Legionella sp. km535 TaxID=2498107 RepID=UPI000F8C560D|nr:potassium-transporting ATPase subunit KdpC [Legionella sp. km535]RUR19093.1 potassium-transporting ATPase subunit KdpC [Legionella sp. km535]